MLLPIRTTPIHEQHHDMIVDAVLYQPLPCCSKRAVIRAGATR